EILRDHRPPTQFSFDGGEQLRPRRFHPPSTPGVRGARRDGPSAGEAEEMINAHRVEQFEDAGEAPDPPGKAGLLVSRPGVLRMAPELSPAVEAIRRVAGDSPRPAMPVELE